jgi:hypothetical protein
MRGNHNVVTSLLCGYLNCINPTSLSRSLLQIQDVRHDAQLLVQQAGLKLLTEV